MRCVEAAKAASGVDGVAAQAAAAVAGASLRADPLADDTIARILGYRDKLQSPTGPQLEAIAVVNRQLAQWETNGALAAWRADADTPAPIAAALEEYVQAALRLPDWADPEKILRAETLFIDMSMLSITLLLCASLPECYVIPDLAAVLHAAGQLERHTDHRIRSTAAMIFPVMMQGGLTSVDGGGVAQALKVRLIHATIRHLILRGEPATALAEGAARVASLPAQGNCLHHTLYARGWDAAYDGLPCNQEELAYTLLTFSYVFLRSLRRLGVGLPPEDEQAYLHAWNVLGHVLGVERALMADSMKQAASMFAQMQARRRSLPRGDDHRPALGAALMRTMQQEIPFRLMKPFPVLLTRHLCGPATARDLALTARVSWLSRALFVALMGTVRAIDWLVRLAQPDFSISRMVTRILGYQFTVKLLLDQTRPLKLPTALLDQVDSAVRTWNNDPKAPKWMNKLEARMTRRRPHPAPAPEGSQAC